MYQGTVDDLKKDVYGNGKPGLKLEFESMKTKIAIFITLQSVTTVAIVSASVKIIFFGV